MGLGEQASPIAQLVGAAERLREVRAAERRFLMLWAIDRSADLRAAAIQEIEQLVFEDDDDGDDAPAASSRIRGLID